MDPIIYTTKPKPDSLPGFYEPTENIFLDGPTMQHLADMHPHDAFILKNVLSPSECERIIQYMNTSDNFEEVGVQGMKDQKDERIGSVRTSIWSPQLAEQIWNKIHKFLPVCNPHSKTATDWWQGAIFEYFPDLPGYKPYPDYTPVAVSPLLRFMKYETNGQHYAHYDAGFIYPDNRYRTLKSMVIYLTTNKGAATRFIDDKQHDLDIWDRSNEDWSREVMNDEIIAKSECIQGNVLIFNHRLCHDVEKYLGTEPRIIIRGDIVYRNQFFKL